MCDVVNLNFLRSMYKYIIYTLTLWIMYHVVISVIPKNGTGHYVTHVTFHVSYLKANCCVSDKQRIGITVRWINLPKTATYHSLSFTLYIKQIENNQIFHLWGLSSSSFFYSLSYYNLSLSNGFFNYYYKFLLKFAYNICHFYFFDFPVPRYIDSTWSKEDS